ncbi:leukocyte receptor cluster member 8-like [Paramacrobiotus metropolitanus]|uniref:leukocyte receptor cluster member 8-like n=1 Tax=Paramacrobiotus metropolitanus TaxID=2943436 RepID=UPI002445ABC0|nr:leukocyte receptor cluster member 8-like [Paramacrobiotus metropolitanus]XP_055345631.1 leukocyte receptor cluster member 8-like [Paramacrobiotus metropolitanus]
MDIECIPPPPPEEFEEPSQSSAYSHPYHNHASSALHDVPLPPGETAHPGGYGGAATDSNSRGLEWQRAMEALNQSNASTQQMAKNAYPTYTSPYAMPATQYYGYGTGYSSAYVAPAYSSISAYPNFAVQYAQAQTASHSSNSSSSSNLSPVFTPRGAAARPRLRGLSKFSPYNVPGKDTNPPQITYQAPPTTYSYNSNAPAVGKSNEPESMDLEEDSSAGAMTATPSATGSLFGNRLARKQAPGAGGIRFQLSKKIPTASSATDVKVSTPLLQRPPTQSSSSQATRLSFAQEDADTTVITTDTGFSRTGNVSRFSSAPKQDYPPSGQPGGAVSSKDWPLSLQEYVTKAIEVTPPEKREQVMQTITMMITNAYKTNTIFTVKWENAPMPYSNDKGSEIFNLSPKRENERPQSVNSGSTSSRGGRRGSNRRTGSGGRYGSDSEDDDDSSYYSIKPGSGSAKESRRFNASPSKKTQQDNSAQDYMPLTGKGLSLSAGAKGQKAGKGKKAAQSARGKLMGMGTEAPMTAAELERLRRRQERFGDLLTSDAPDSPAADTPVPSLPKAKKAFNTVSPLSSLRSQKPNRSISAPRTIIGTCQTVEKDYFRLTDHVDPAQVRPVYILEQALDLVKRKWKAEKEYRYAESQLKSMRQDLRVQHVFSPFTVAVYETHARIALEVGDQAEFTQCLAQLEWLYDVLMKTGGGGEQLVKGCEHRREFLSYRILYVMRQNRTTDAAKARMNLSVDDKKDTCIAFAFSVLSAYFAGDYQQFFTFYKLAPLMASYVMDVAIPQFRQKSLIKLCNAYRPNLPVMALKELLCFPTEREMRDFLKAYPKMVYTWMNGLEEIDTKASLTIVKAGPEPVTDGPVVKPTPITPQKTGKTGRFRAKVK